MSELPVGTVTFLFTDLEASTRLWEQHPDAMQDALARHDDMLLSVVTAHGGHIVKSTGDGVHAVFAIAHDAVAAATDAQVRLQAESWPTPEPLRVRMGVHTCEVELRDGDYYGSEVNRAARLMAVAHGGQVLVSETVASLVRGGLPPDVGLFDLGEHRLRDLTRAIGVYQVTHPDLAREFPPLQSLDVLPGNLPVQMTSFVGREDELARVVEELGESRVVTLTGVGGVGKTRLALEVAAEVVPQYRAGAWLVELAGVRDPDAVPGAVAAAFGLQPRTGMSPVDMLVEFLRGKELLLILDNCEHLLRTVAELVGNVVRACPGVKVLATSREGLNVAGERMLGVASLDVPDEAAPLATIAQCDAVVLFVDRARAVKANFVLDDANARMLAQVCRRLDGIALAIELAAARVGMLTPAEMARRLDQRFRLLAGRQHTAVERHQTLQAAIDWSYDLLSESEQLVLARLSIFAGGFSLEAAEAVTAGGVVEADDVFEHVASLVARSLVVADTEGIDTRYRLLETIRQYAQEHLDGSGEGERLRTEHAAYYTRFVETAIANATGPDGEEWEHRLEREPGNYRAALTWVTDNADVDTALRLVGVWDGPIYLTFDDSLLASVRWACDALLAIPGAEAHAKYPVALEMLALDAWQRGEQELAERRCDEAEAAERRLGSEPSIALWELRCVIALAQGRTADAIDAGSHAVDLCRARAETVRLVNALGWLGLAHAIAGNTAEASGVADEIVAVTRQLANPHLVQQALSLAAFALASSDLERAMVLARESVALAGEKGTAAWAVLGDLTDRNGNRLDALRSFARAIDFAHWQGNRLVLGTMVGRVAAIIAGSEPEASAVLQGAGDARAPAFAQTAHAVEEEKLANEAIDAALGATRHAELVAEGAAMTDDDAVAYALAAIARVVGNGG
jgi:predicted ATPase/class 3 adenylate cyclase